ncbi:MAG: bifunctional nicotinamidase/pyrazinamidase [Pyramidobacter sp.]|nr:bifunctional nicotinamidase/pyrazinamidase [Pyramidobacter sp.]
MKKTAILLVDVQNDFCTGGALAVRDGDAVVPVCNELIGLAAAHGCPVMASRDWHPEDHCSFKAQGGPWPVHCVAEKTGAQFHPDLNLPADAVIVSKGTKSGADAYSAFDGTNAAAALREKGIERLLICGLATDYCVKATVLDALKSGFSVVVVQDGCRAVNVCPDDGEKAFAEMAAQGAAVCPLAKVEW